MMIPQPCRCTAHNCDNSHVSITGLCHQCRRLCEQRSQPFSLFYLLLGALVSLAAVLLIVMVAKRIAEEIWPA